MEASRLIRDLQRPDGPDTIAERFAQREAARLAVADREARYPVLTTDNAREAIAYQEERITDHLQTTRNRNYIGGVQTKR